jgi:hypothetical protein
VPLRLTLRDLDLLQQLIQAEEMSKSTLLESCSGDSLAYVRKRVNRLIEEGYMQKIEGGGIVLGEKGKRVLRGIQQPAMKRNRSREWTDRDVEVLTDLYQMRESTKERLVEKHFAGRESYGRKRLEVMKREWMLAVKRVGILGQKGAVAYCLITEKGIRLLVERGMIPEKDARARDLKLTEKQRAYIMDANEIHFRLNMPKLTFLNSRQIKRQYQLNRGNLVAGAFSTGEKNHFLYVLQEEVKLDTLKRMAKELGEVKQRMGGYLVYARSAEAKNALERILEKQEIVTGGLPIHVLPLNERGFEITRRLIIGKGLAQLLEPHGKLIIKPSDYGFEYGMKYRDGTNKYVLEYLTGDRMVIDRSFRMYKGVKSNGESQGVLLFCWEEDVEAMQERVKLIPYSVEVIGLSFKTAFESSLPNPRKGECLENS